MVEAVSPAETVMECPQCFSVNFIREDQGFRCRGRCGRMFYVRDGVAYGRICTWCSTPVETDSYAVLSEAYYHLLCWIAASDPAQRQHRPVPKTP